MLPHVVNFAPEDNVVQRGSTSLPFGSRISSNGPLECVRSQHFFRNKLNGTVCLCVVGEKAVVDHGYKWDEKVSTPDGYINHGPYCTNKQGATRAFDMN